MAHIVSPPEESVLFRPRIVSTPEESVLFRPNKKRKHYRQRGPDDDASSRSPPHGQGQTSNPSLAPAITDHVSPGPDEPEGSNISISEILRLRKLRKQRMGGVEFRPVSTVGKTDDTEDGALVLHNGKADEQKEKVQAELGGVRKFAKQTGMVGDVDKHMMAYIDSELAKRRLHAPPPITDTKPATETGPRSDTPSEGAVKSTKPAERQPATLGKLLEIDLGNEARHRNVVRTEQARRRLDGEAVDDESVSERKPKRVRLGRNGKPWRERKRRASDDIRRDKLVEEVLRENRQLYDEPAPPLIPPSSGDGGDDGEADDRIAEAFRREFMDAVSQRQRKKAVPTASTARGAAGKKEEEALKGPKLGGSRSARAAMREAQLKELKTARK